MAVPAPPLAAPPAPAGAAEPGEALRVSTSSEVRALAGAIAGCVRRSGSVTLEVIGAGALNQAIKAAVVARAITVRDGLDLVVLPSFQNVDIGGHRRTALRLVVAHRPPVGQERRSPSERHPQGRRPGCS